MATPLTAGTALDLGCGEGNDEIWLAALGWRVSAVDVSATALQRASARAADAGVASRMDFRQHDLPRTFPDGEFDLVCAQYLHSPVQFPRDQVLHRAARAVAPGGLLLVVAHGSARPWAWKRDPHTRFPTAGESLAALELHRARWAIEISDALQRQATGPCGESATVIDIVTAARRRRVCIAGMTSRPGRARMGFRLATAPKWRSALDGRSRHADQVWTNCCCGS